MPGYEIASSDGTRVCVPFLATAARPPAGYRDGDFYVEEFTDAKLKARWEACKADSPCHERLKPQIALPPNQARATRATGAVDPFDLPSVACSPAKELTNIKGAIMLASFGSGAGYLPDFAGPQRPQPVSWRHGGGK